MHEQWSSRSLISRGWKWFTQSVAMALWLRCDLWPPHHLLLGACSTLTFPESHSGWKKQKAKANLQMSTQITMQEQSSVYSLSALLSIHPFLAPRLSLTIKPPKFPVISLYIKRNRQSTPGTYSVPPQLHGLLKGHPAAAVVEGDAVSSP